MAGCRHSAGAIGCDEPIRVDWKAPSGLSYADLQAVALETRADALVDVSSRFFCHNPDYYVVTSNRSIMLFDRSGRLKTTITAQGRGPEEAYDLRHIAVAGSRLLVSDLGRRRMLEYGFDGRFRRVWPLERSLHNFTWLNGRIILDNQTADNDPECGIIVCDESGKTLRPLKVPIVGKKLGSGLPFFMDGRDCYYMAPYHSSVYRIDPESNLTVACRFDFGNRAIPKEVADRFAEMQDPFMPFLDYLVAEKKLHFVRFFQTAEWLHLGMACGDRSYNWFCNKGSGRQYLIPCDGDDPSPWRCEVVGVEGGRFVVKVEAVDYRTWPGCALKLRDDDNPVLLLCRPHE